ncbi:hybrid sensor histidine kinase/response regulator [Algibacter pectinivorans]|uniref:histidine kinase n=1 Tax=Algibacter pectinivorans TaxID=870482 RepID=A0A1I1S6W9_9FLAO|nr:hybrid sensor histidine kinase/response regulator [Algibacter pectinivorans]SFD42259.1 Signal transduction histidine kinase [Algibacter pectinivorans]
MKRLLIVIYIFSFGLLAQNDVYDIQQSTGELYEFAEFANAEKTEFSISEILENSGLQYSKLESENHNIGFTSHNYWVRFKLKNSSNTTNTYYLKTARPITDHVNLYQISNGHIQHFLNGDNINFSEKQVQHRSTIFKIAVPPHVTQQIYINYKSDGETINLPLIINDESSFWMVNYNQQLFLGLFYGLLFLAGIIYLFFYTSLKEMAFFYYGLYVFSIALMQASLDGLIHQYILTEAGFFNSSAVLITGLLSNLFFLKYCEHFLRVKYNLKGFMKTFKVLYALITLIFLFLIINKHTVELAYPLTNLSALITLIVILATIITLRVKGVKVDPFFSIGIVFLVVGMLGFVMNNLSLLPNNFFTLNSSKFGSGFEVVFLSLSMTNLIKKLRLEKDKSREEALQKSQEISALKTYFMSNMSHELRTPINAIMGVAENELEFQTNKKNREPFQIIKNASLSLLSNVNDIIDFEKIENKALELNFQTFNPSIKLNQISSNWKAEALKKGLDYTFEMDSEIPANINADPDRFVQIINNVLSNAIKFTEKGHVLFKLKCLKQPNDTCRFSFQITDTGIGIDKTNKNEVFDSFNQMKLNHKREFGGIGLGLTIVKHIVELFNGNITIESEPNKGTNVFIDLNLKYSIEQKTATATNVQNETPLHILVVEDNKLNQMVMKKILSTNSQITFAIANNGKEAIEALKKDVYDIILMDLQMPIMDGYEATQIIRSGELGNTIHTTPIIAVTADAMEATKQRVLDLGMNAYMTKPINKTLLFENINACNFNKQNGKDDEDDKSVNLQIA